MAYIGQDDEQQALLQQQLGGTPLNTTMPVGQPSPLTAAAPPARPFASYGTADIAGEEQLGWGDPSRMTGFNTNAWGTDERGSNTVKNSFGKIASRYDPRQSGAAQSVSGDSDFQRLFPEARLVQHAKGDLIDFDGDGPEPPVDVLRNAVEGGSGDAWAFQAGGDGGGAMPAQGGGMDPMAMLGGQGNSLDALGESDVLAQILKELQGAQGGDEGQALLQSLMGVQ